MLRVECLEFYSKPVDFFVCIPTFISGGYAHFYVSSQAAEPFRNIVDAFSDLLDRLFGSLFDDKFKLV